MLLNAIDVSTSMRIVCVTCLTVVIQTSSSKISHCQMKYSRLQNKAIRFRDDSFEDDNRVQLAIEFFKGGVASSDIVGRAGRRSITTRRF